ncbi:hypothetical protein GF324_14210 [bacterium]|nr:hypothetical protein [bacterium]
MTTLAREKVEQAFGLMQEKNLDAWLTFVRETDIVHDPALDMILDKPCTWSIEMQTAAGFDRPCFTIPNIS